MKTPQDTHTQSDSISIYYAEGSPTAAKVIARHTLAHLSSHPPTPTPSLRTHTQHTPSDEVMEPKVQRIFSTVSHFRPDNLSSTRF